MPQCSKSTKALELAQNRVRPISGHRLTRHIAKLSAETGARPARKTVTAKGGITYHVHRVGQYTFYEPKIHKGLQAASIPSGTIRKFTVTPAQCRAKRSARSSRFSKDSTSGSGSGDPDPDPGDPPPPILSAKTRPLCLRPASGGAA